MKDFIPIKDLIQETSNRNYRIYEDNSFHYCSPCSGGWGIVRVASLVPQSEVLFISPQGCARHGVLASYKFNNRNKINLLYVSKIDFALGTHMEKVEEAVEIILDKNPSLKAITLICSCIDDLLGSDYDSLAIILEKKFKIKVRVGRMDPIKNHSKTPPHPMIQKTIYDYLSKSHEKGSHVNVIGSFANINSDCKLCEILNDRGIHIRHIADCKTFDEFMYMSKAKLNILVNEMGSLATKSMKHRLGMDYLYLPHSYRVSQIEENYKKLFEKLGIKRDFKDDKNKCDVKIEEMIKDLKEVKVAIGSTVNAYQFELARELEERGIRVEAIFANVIRKSELEHVKWLSNKASHIKVFADHRPSMAFLENNKLDVDIAIGVDGAYFTKSPYMVDIPLDVQPFGFDGVIEFYEKLLKPQKVDDHIKLVYDHNLVI